MIRVALIVLTLALLGGCRGGDRGDTVVLWHAYNGDELSALEAAVDVLERERDLKVALVSVPYEAFADKLTNAIPNGNGPDLFIFAHDRLGAWVESGLVEPIEFYVDEELADRFAYDALAAMAYERSLYGLPLAVKTVALFHRTDLVAAPPRTTDEIFALAASLRAGGYDGHALIYENTNLYGHAPWLHGSGGGVLGEDGAPSVASPEAIAALELARRFDRDGVVPDGIDGRLVATLFSEGKAAMAISGPWFLGDLEPGVPWAVTTLPVVSATGLPARPFLGAEGVLMSTRARDKDRAFAVMEALSSDTAAELRARTARQIVPNPGAYAAADLAADPVARAFRDQIERSVAMPSTPAMRMVWTPYQTALLAVIEQDADPAAALAAAAREIESFTEGAP